MSLGAEFGLVFVETLPRVPLRADELAGHAVALRAGEVDAQVRAEFERHAAVRGLLERTLVEIRADLVRPGGQDLVEQARVQRAGGDGVHIDLERREFERERFRQAHDGRLAGGVGADVGHGIGRAAAGKVDDLAVAAAFLNRRIAARQGRSVP